MSQPETPRPERDEAQYHLTRAADIMKAVASAVDKAADPYLPVDMLAAAFRQAEIHALIGQGYATLYGSRAAL
jgi:hypothetical protein